MANSNLHDQIYKQLSKELNVPIDIVEKVCRSQMEFISKVIEKGGKESVRLKYLGIFGVKKLRQEYLDGNKEQKSDKQEPNIESNE